MGDKRECSPSGSPQEAELQLLIERVREELLPELIIQSVEPHEPVVARRVPHPWRLVGAGNYAAVVAHPAAPGYVVKVYAPGRPGLAEEVEVYRRLGRHPAYSECCYSDDQCLVLRRLDGITLYNCIRRGIPIPRQVIRDIDAALEYAVQRGLRPHDVHGKNVMMKDGRGVVVDVSDFLKPEPCRMWSDLKRAYYLVYLPLPLLHRLPLPDFVLNGVRRGYRLLKKRRARRSC